MKPLAALAALLLLAACGPTPLPQAAKPAAPAPADFLATKVCPNGATPTVVKRRLTWPCPAPSPLGPTTPITWMMQGALQHSGDPGVYPTRTAGIADPAGAFYDLSQTNVFSSCPAWEAVADPGCDDGAMDVVWAQTLADLGAGQTAHVRATLWGVPGLGYFPGLGCQQRPAGAVLRYIVFAAGLPLNTWREWPEWWPRNAETPAPDCTEDGTGRTALAALYHGIVEDTLTVGGKAQPVRLEVFAGETYWWGAPQPLAMEKIYYARDLGFLRYEYWCDSTLSDCLPILAAMRPALAKVLARHGVKRLVPRAMPATLCPHLYTNDGQDISTPHEPTGTGGSWVLGICTYFNALVAVPPGLTAQAFFAPQTGFPGVSQ